MLRELERREEAEIDTFSLIKMQNADRNNNKREIGRKK